ncbi:hypothetical protein CTAYLR_002822 [Chrysophaeum taylorii]|uniref:peptide-methionine (S)-S-oxide reductase n=1 Tax=Chrysophaeum taylorii TaxID=2483200 RepID=A0AAD7U7W5_9STRA|nr:hypothetical protein CTAYLR_002822 [Chrysophaeum taylorii]
MGEELKESPREAVAVSTRVGYTGGATANPTYSSVCSGKTGHSEAVRVTYDPSVVSYEQLLSKFFALHDYKHPSKAQYMSAIFPQDDDQRKVAEHELAKLEGPVATVLKGATPWYDAEDYHQDYLNKRLRVRRF